MESACVTALLMTQDLQGSKYRSLCEELVNVFLFHVILWCVDSATVITSYLLMYLGHLVLIQGYLNYTGFYKYVLICKWLIMY